MFKTASYWLEKRASLDKQALNAMKAREMASAAGLHPVGNWKWGLRHLRDNRGNLLQGRSLAEAKEGLGKLPNNVRQSVQSLSRKSGGKEVALIGTKQTPLSQAIKTKVNRNDVASDRHIGNFSIGDQEGVAGTLPLLNLDANSADEAYGGLKNLTHDIHTHPIAPAFKNITDDHYVDPSAIEHLNGLKRQLSDPLTRKLGLHDIVSREHRELADEIKEARLMAAEQRAKATPGPGLVMPSAYQTRRNNPTHYNRTEDSLVDLMDTETGDYASYTLNHLYNPNNKSTILDPIGGNESVHKVRPYGLRSLYFQNKGTY